MTYSLCIQEDFHLAWQFDCVLPGAFRRDRNETRGRDFPIVGPLPTLGKRTPPIEGQHLVGPYLYAVIDSGGVTRYVGKATEAGLPSPIARWIRPDDQGGSHLWAHGTNKKGRSTVEWLCEGINVSRGPYRLYFSNYEILYAAVRTSKAAGDSAIRAFQQFEPEAFVRDLEAALIFELQPEWNQQSKRKRPDENMRTIAQHWLR